MTGATDPRAVASLVAGAIAISFAPILVRAAGASGLGPTPIAFWRCALGTVFLLALALARRRPLRLPPPVAALMLLAALAFAVDLFVWHRSIVLIGAGMSTILGNTQVFGTALLSVWLFGERLTPRFVAAAAAALAGVVLLVGLGSSVAFTADYLRGVAYGLATGLTYAVFLVTVRSAGRRDDGRSTLTSLLWLSALATLFLTGLSSLDGEPLAPPDARTWVWLALLALVAQSLGWWIIARTLPRVPGALAGLILLLQPVLATIWGAALFGERLRPLQIAGALITLGAIYAGSRGTRAAAG